MPPTGPISRLVICPPNTIQRSEWSCACGAKAQCIDVFDFANPQPVTIPGALLEECTCPKCILCGWVLDSEQRCDNLDCPLVGTLIPLPD